ncbi:MAG: hypothetical protein ABI778_10190, partial [Ignavibacteriota bacterium]
MKKLIVLLLLLSPMVLLAQTGRLINRIDREEAAKLVQSEAGKTSENFFVKTAAVSDKVLLSQQAGGEHTFNIVMGEESIQFDPGDVAIIHGSMTNLTNSPVKIIFNRKHIRRPTTEWTSSICFGTNCFSADKDDLDPDYAFVLDPATIGDFFLNIYENENFTGVDSIIDYIKFTAVGSTEADTLSFTLKGVLNEQLGVEDNQPKAATAPKIVTIYPSPLVEGNSIKVKISSPRESNLSYSIYDGVGRV